MNMYVFLMISGPQCIWYIRKLSYKILGGHYVLHLLNVKLMMILIFPRTHFVWNAVIFNILIQRE